MQVVYIIEEFESEGPNTFIYLCGVFSSFEFAEREMKKLEEHADPGIVYEIREVPFNAVIDD